MEVRRGLTTKTVMNQVETGMDTSTSGEDVQIASDAPRDSQDKNTRAATRAPSIIVGVVAAALLADLAPHRRDLPLHLRRKASVELGAEVLGQAFLIRKVTVHRHLRATGLLRNAAIVLGTDGLAVRSTR